MVRLLIACMRLIAPLPLPLLRALGWVLGMLLFALAHARRHVVQVNLRHCFPALPDAERAALARQHFVQVGRRLKVEFQFDLWFTQSLQLLDLVVQLHLLLKALSQVQL
jgi:lauroyl/myristoyl acyltransferase